MPSAQTGTQISRIYFPDLDGWRFVAFLSVFLFHAFYTDLEQVKNEPIYWWVKRLTSNGFLGVEFFFVLSGFLIIYLLISEREKTGKIDIRKFYLRRVLRIFPLYYLCLFIGFVIFPYIRSILGTQTYTLPDWRYYVFFLSNFDSLKEYAPLTDASLGVLWSVAIEEQFYLTVPLLLVIVGTRFYPWIFIVAIAVSLVSRALHVDDSLWLARHTFSYIGNIAIGGLIAYYSITSRRFVNYFEELDGRLIKAVYALIIIVVMFQAELFFTPALRASQALIVAGLFAFIILEQNYSKNSFFKMRNNRTFTKLGLYTYGLYCLHVIAMAGGHLVLSRLRLNTELWQVIVVETSFNLSLALIFAYISYRYYEAPFLRLKAAFSFQNRSSVDRSKI